MAVGHMQTVCISLQTDKSAPCSRQITTSSPHHSSFLQAGCPSCHPTNSVKALKAYLDDICATGSAEHNWGLPTRVWMIVINTRFPYVRHYLNVLRHCLNVLTFFGLLIVVQFLLSPGWLHDVTVDYKSAFIDFAYASTH